jgi:hypothetical protein
MIFDAILGVAALIVAGVIFANSGIEPLTTAGGYILGVAVLFVAAIIIAIFLHSRE